MRQLSGTTVTGGMTILGLIATGCFTVWSVRGGTPWLIVGWVCIGLAMLLFLFGWLVPRIISRIISGGEAADESAGVQVDQAPNVNVQANVAKEGGGGIDVNVNVSVPSEEDAGEIDRDDEDE